MSCLFLLLDARADPIGAGPWGALILLLVIVFVLSVAFVAALVALFDMVQASQGKASRFSCRRFIPISQTIPRR